MDGLLIGPENALAHASVQALARGDEAGSGLQPLVLHGPSGVGKSRLLNVLVELWLARHPGDSVAQLEAEAFAAYCAEAANRRGGWAELRERFRELNLLVIEDLHSLTRAPMALEELGHTLDALAETGATVAASAREGPGRWLRSGWPARVVSRLVGGLSVRVEPPGAESRRRFVLERARAQGLTLAAEAIDSLADSADGYRTLEGWLARLALADRLEHGSTPKRGTPHILDQARVEAILAEDVAVAESEAEALRTLTRITEAVAARFGLRPRDLRSASRRQALVVPRHLAIYLARQRTGLSFATLGAHFGGRDTKTIRHACQAAARRLASDPALAAVAESLNQPTIPSADRG